QNILIIRSFDADDPIKNILEQAISSRRNTGALRFLNINIVDVKSKSEFIGALRNFTGKIVIIDCHGNHGGHKDQAWLHIGDDKVNIWTLKADFRIPPIFLLSACSTHPIDGSNTSVANGLISIGAHSVLATLLPISANHSAIFISKFLHWIDFYLAIDKEKHPTFALWRDIVSEIMRCMYVQDILNYFEVENLINENQF
ncbi:TPA: CHAT domain-containing protein, partial [Legionella pneumophila]